MALTLKFHHASEPIQKPEISVPKATASQASLNPRVSCRDCISTIPLRPNKIDAIENNGHKPMAQRIATSDQGFKGF